MTQIDALIREADPVDPADPHLRSDHPDARAVFAAARARVGPGGPAKRQAPSPRPRAARPAAVAAAAAALAVVLASGTGDTSPNSARAAMVKAAQRAAELTSGRIVTTGTYDLADGGHSRHVLDLRFDGSDVVSEHEITETSADGTTVTHRHGHRQVDRRLYHRPDDRWRLLGTTDDDPRLALASEAAVRPQDLVDLLRRATDATREDAADGATTYRGTVTTGDLDAVVSPMAILPMIRVGDRGREVAIELTVGGDGIVRSVEFRERRFSSRTTYSELGQPQEIEAPPAARRDNGCPKGSDPSCVAP